MSRQTTTSHAGTIAGVAALAAAAGTALWVGRRAAAAERAHPPEGRKLDIDGVGVHVVERGSGPAVVLIHGNNVSLADFAASGLLDDLAGDRRVIAFDRPGYGHSERPRDRIWSPAAQADLLRGLLDRLGIERATIVGHSMGTLVALELALQHPQRVERLVLLSGYYYPEVRMDALLASPVAVPVLGDVMRYTVTAVAARATLDGTVKAMFAPNPVPPDYVDLLSREMLVRPSQLRANAEDAAFMMSAASRIASRLESLRLPVVILAGADDVVVDPEDHAVRLHDDIVDSELMVLPSVGHMLHHVAGDAVVKAVLAPLVDEGDHDLVADEAVQPA